ncbi:MAG: NosD domain-containing protein, partial [Promethearchaeia archaeon]
LILGSTSRNNFPENTSEMDQELLSVSYNTTDPISVDGNEEFGNLTDDKGFSGEGTLGNPYVIQGVKIDAEGSGNCIEIRNTDEYFNISSSLLVNSGSGSSGIHLENVTHGALYNNTIKSTGYGIRLIDSTNFNITQNALLNNKYGVKIEGSSSQLDIWQNYFLYSELFQIDIDGNEIGLTNDTAGNYWSNINRALNKENDNFTTTINGEDITFFICDSKNNYTISDSLVDENPLTVNDTDEDGLDDLEEVLYWETNISNSDSDGDGMPDYWEAINNLDPTVEDGDQDPDDDGLINLHEWGNNTDPYDPDTDNDGWSDGAEVEKGYDPNNPYDHPDFGKETSLEISFGLTYLVFLVGGIFLLLSIIKQKRINIG